MILTDDEFVHFLAKGEFRTKLGDVIQLPESMYKKGNRQLNAEKTMMMVLKARSNRSKLSLGYIMPPIKQDVTPDTDKCYPVTAGPKRKEYKP